MEYIHARDPLCCYTPTIWSCWANMPSIFLETLWSVHTQAPAVANVNHDQFVQAAAFEAYSNRDFQETVGLLTRIMNVQPKEPRWYEMRAQVSDMALI